MKRLDVAPIRARLRAGVARARAAVPTLSRDAAGLVGAATLAHGLGQVYGPLQPICGGLMLMAAAFLLSLRKAP